MAVPRDRRCRPQPWRPTMTTEQTPNPTEQDYQSFMHKFGAWAESLPPGERAIAVGLEKVLVPVTRRSPDRRPARYALPAPGESAREVAMSEIYHEGNRRLQDAFDTRRLADRMEERIIGDVIDENDRRFIESLDMF